MNGVDISGREESHVAPSDEVATLWPDGKVEHVRTSYQIYWEGREETNLLGCLYS